jgi:hypothetical protein
MKAVATSKLPIIAAATTVAGAIALAFWLKKSRNTNSDDDDESYISDIYEPELPTHMMRAIHKEQRRKASVQFLAMKKPMYDNIVRIRVKFVSHRSCSWSSVRPNPPSSCLLIHLEEPS